MDTGVKPGSPLAAIDMGSNSFRLEIGQMPQTRYRRIDYLKETVRLGAGLDSNGMLTEEAAQRGLVCLRRFASRLAGFAPGQVRAVATQTLREARNRNAFLLRAQEALGHPIEVISGREEARLIYAGVAHMQPSDEPRLVVDIGGRSTEMIRGQGRTPQVAESFRVGCVSLSMRFFEGGQITRDGFRAVKGDADHPLLDPVFGETAHDVGMMMLDLENRQLLLPIGKAGGRVAGMEVAGDCPGLYG